MYQVKWKISGGKDGNYNAGVIAIQTYIFTFLDTSDTKKNEN